MTDMKTRMRQLLLPVLLALMMPQATRADGINETPYGEEFPKP